MNRGNVTQPNKSKSFETDNQSYNVTTSEVKQESASSICNLPYFVSRQYRIKNKSHRSKSIIDKLIRQAKCKDKRRFMTEGQQSEDQSGAKLTKLCEEIQEEPELLKKNARMNEKMRKIRQRLLQLRQKRGYRDSNQQTNEGETGSKRIKINNSNQSINIDIFQQYIIDFIDMV